MSNRLNSTNNAEKRVRKNTTVVLDGEQISIDIVFKLIQNTDILALAQKLNMSDIRKLVSSFYQIQRQRIRTNNQVFQFQERNEECYSMEELLKFFNSYETRVQNVMEAWVNLPGNLVAQWCVSNPGIATILSSGLISNIDITKAPTAGSILRYFGQDPTSKWITDEKKLKEIVDTAMRKYDQTNIDNTIITEVCSVMNRSYDQTANFLIHKKGYDEFDNIAKEDFINSLKLPPYNQECKTLCWKLGESFLKQKNKVDDIYGKLIDARKVYENAKNDRGDYVDQAKVCAAHVSMHTQAFKYYSSGKLSPDHILSRAKRFAVKIFISHLHAIMYWDHYKALPPRPFAMSILGHKDYIRIPRSDIVNFPEDEYYTLGTQIGSPKVLID